jgi:hypothetical protein
MSENLRWIYEVNPLIERGGVGDLRILHYVDRDGDIMVPFESIIFVEEESV